MLRLLVFPLTAGFLLAAAPTHAQTPAETPAGRGDIDILADRLEETDGLVLATGNVEITRGRTRLSADRVELNRATGDAVATGRVVFFDGQDRLTGGRIEYNLNNGTGVVHDAEAFSEPYYRLSGERMERVEESVYKLYRGVFTTCQDDPPTWSVHLGSGTADFDDYLVGRSASLWVLDFPVTPALPFFAAALRRERQTGFLFPTVGDSSRKGMFIHQPFFWAISDSQDLTMALDAYSLRGVGANAEYRYLLSDNAQGVASGFFVQETELNNDLRGHFRVRHNWTIDADTSFRVDAQRVSDDDLFREYSDLLYERSLQRTDSHVFLSRRLGQWNFVGDFFWYQDLTSPHPVELKRLPDLRLANVREPVPGVPGALWDLESSGIHFVRDAGAEGSRLDLHGRIVRPFRPLGLFTVTPFVGARTTTYDQQVIGTEERYAERVVLERTEDSLRTRVLGEAGVDVEARASRVYDFGIGPIDKVAHVIEPRVNYTFMDGANKDRLPQYDSVDGLGRSNTVTYSLTNRLIGRTTPGADGQSMRWEMARLELAGTFDADAGRRPLGNVTGDLILNAGGGAYFRADAAYDPNGGRGFESVNSDFGLRVGNLNVLIGQRYSGTSGIEFIHGEATIPLSQYLALRGATNWDANQGVFIDSRVGADILFQCWSFSVTYVNRSKQSNPEINGQRVADNEVRFTLNLLGLGSMGTTASGGP